jgi:hypothetical protein
VVPAALPVTTPEVLTEAIEVLALLHVPPVVSLVSVKVLPTHTDEGPPIAAGVLQVAKGVILYTFPEPTAYNA